MRSPVVFAGSIENFRCRLSVSIFMPDAMSAAGVVDHTKTRRFPALIDTGATCSAIRREVADLMRLPDDGPGVFAGMGPMRPGRFVKARLAYHIDEQSVMIRDARLAVVEMDATMVLGMAELMDGNFTVDGAARTWKWETWSEPLST